MAQAYHFRNLIFEGGGVKGIAYVGALREMHKAGVLGNIQRVGGTSAGAINAVLVATGHTLKETFDLLSDLDFEKFLDSSWGIARDINRLRNKYGWYKGDFVRKWIGKRIAAKIGNPDATFNDFRQHGFKDLFLVGTNLSTGFSEVFSAEHTPRMSVAGATRISMSIPLFFKCVRGEREDVYVDGGVLRNYPIKLFDRQKYIRSADLKKHAREPKYYDINNKKLPKGSSRYLFNKETLGVRLDTEAEIAMCRDGAEPPTTEIRDFFDYALALMKTVLGAQGNAHIHSDDWQRTVYIDTLGVGTTDFKLSNARKKALIKSSADGVKRYLDWYNNASGPSRPMNHPGFKGA